MTGKTYQEMAMRTKSISNDDSYGMLMHSILGLNSEAGEVAGEIQKMYQRHKEFKLEELDVEHITNELGDCLWMIAEACEALGLTLEDVMELNIKKLQSRFPEGFTVKDDTNRKNGDI